MKFTNKKPFAVTVAGHNVEPGESITLPDPPKPANAAPKPKPAKPGTSEETES